MLLKNKKIGFAITGSFCNFQYVFPQIKKLSEEGADIYPIISNSVDIYDTRFGTSKEWKERLINITGKEIIKNIVEAEPVGPKLDLDLLIVAPATGNTAAKIANAITDTSVTMAVKAHLRNNKPVVLSIATNDGLGANLKNIGLLMNTKNIYFVPFSQDAPLKKPKSLVSHFDKIIPTIQEALKGNQIQPILL
ncbi:dipicolinate synthase subunit B [Senegalia massiliensis]|jgi:dipicolinate synthase subunit B|uniref:dipicolinate synthase subunit B n=1 Tax=Senegalia massiliensis TaxID=1720316 RepID=UPI00103017E2|nr:dipicolinate synthase subunit B [Senegalia massiliensis]